MCVGRGGGGGGGGQGGWYINDCARACMHACVCVHELVHKLRYDGINEVYNHICLSFRISLSTYLCTHTYAHTHTYIYVCVCLDALTLDEEKNFIYLRLSHIKR